jgi:hypothetical protein
LEIENVENITSGGFWNSVFRKRRGIGAGALTTDSAGGAVQRMLEILMTPLETPIVVTPSDIQSLKECQHFELHWTKVSPLFSPGANTVLA